MAAPRWVPRPGEFEEAAAKATSVADLSARLGVAKETLRRWARESGVDLSPYQAVTGRGRRVVYDSPSAQVEHDREVKRLTDRIKELEKLYEAANAEANLHEEVLRAAHQAMEPLPAVAPEAPHIGKSDIDEDAILAWADWHFGEVIDFDVMRGFNVYDPVIACRRAQYTVDTTLDILFSCHVGTTFKRLFVFDLGDSINGDHLPEQMATNAAGVFRSMRMAALVKAAALAELSAHIPVTYVAVPGNHGRRSQKMQWKDPTETADWLIAEMVRDLVRQQERVEVIVPRAWTVGIDIRGWSHSLNHGYSAARGGYGGIPFYAFQRTDGKMTALESSHGRQAHHRWYGHIHTHAELPKLDGVGEQHIVGSLKGGDEYALEELHSYSEPTQKLVGCHEKFGVSWRYPLQVKWGDESASRYEKLLDQYMASATLAT